MEGSFRCWYFRGLRKARENTGFFFCFPAQLHGLFFTCAVSILASRKRLLFGKGRRAGWREIIFYLCFRRLQKAAENMGFFCLIYAVSILASRKRLLFGKGRRAGWREIIFYLTQVATFKRRAFYLSFFACKGLVESRR